MPRVTAASPAQASPRRFAGAWASLRHSPLIVTAILCAALIVMATIAASIGAAGIPLQRLLAATGLAAGDPALIERDRLVLWSIRLPRIAMACMIGAMLATAGTIMQGLFRNPLAEPGLVGVSAGAALAAAATIVLGDRILAGTHVTLPFAILPIAAFGGALVTTAILYRFATREGRTSIATLLLAGLAIGALAQAGIGLLIFMADDRQLRDITFWTLGSLSGSTWGKAGAIAPFLLALVMAVPFIANGLDRMVLGEAEAFHMGVAVERLKRAAIVLVAAAAGAAVAFAGIIGFVGIVVPHLLRLLIGPDNRYLLPASALLGASMLLLADAVSRTIVAPAELPIGIVTATVGAPFFLWILLRRRGILDL
jgi:iron complex transport system permease protein